MQGSHNSWPPPPPQYVARGPINNTDLGDGQPAIIYNYTQFANKTAGVTACQQQCDKNSNCSAWTFVIGGGVANETERCCLHGQLGCPLPKSGMLSGAKVDGARCAVAPPPRKSDDGTDGERGACAYKNLEGVSQPGELLNNGICIPTGPGHWPPPHWYRDPSPPAPPYLTTCLAGVTSPSCRPAAINIDTGRQLFVDDFIVGVSRTNATRVFHSAVIDNDPVIRPTLPWEESGRYNPNWGTATSVLPFPGGVWYVDDAPPARRFQMFYYVPSGPTAVAYSADGITWTKVGTGPGGESGPSGLNTVETPT